MIVAENLTVRYRRGRRRKIVALDDVSLEVRAGDVFALLGPNGAGKSTAMRCFLGLLQPDSGSVRVLGRDPEPGAPQFARIGYVPEEPHYHLYLTVEEAVAFYGGLSSRPPAPERITSALERVGMAEYRDLRLSKCSKGMKQKTGLAAALLHEPDLLLLDEPTRGLDPVVVRDLRKLFLDLNRQGVTIVLTSHVLSEVEALCNRVAILRQGRLVAQDELANLRRPDPQRYRVTLIADEAAVLPPFLEVSERRDGIVEAELPAARVSDLFAAAEAQGWTVNRCSVVERSLEDSFFAALEEGT